MAKELPIIMYNKKHYLWDDKAKKIRNIEDPSDFVMFQDLDLSKMDDI